MLIKFKHSLKVKW